MGQRCVLARFRFKGQTIRVENVPVWVCNRCGEQYFDAPVFKCLEERLPGNANEFRGGFL